MDMPSIYYPMDGMFPQNRSQIVPTKSMWKFPYITFGILEFELPSLVLC